MEDILKNIDPKELKKLKKKMKQWSSQPGGKEKIENMMRSFGGMPTPEVDTETEDDPRTKLRRRLADMKNKRTGKK